MAIVYLTNQVTPFNQMQGLSNYGVQAEEFKITVPAAVGFANTDTIVLAAIPLNATLLGFYISAPALDTGGSITFEIGDTVDVDRYVASTSTTGRAAFDLWHNGFNGFVAGSLPFTYTTQTTLASPGDVTGGKLGVLQPPVSSTNVADWLLIRITAANTTPAVTGTLKGYVLYDLNTNIAP
jgi:hypothetical protein